MTILYSDDGFICNDDGFTKALRKSTKQVYPKPKERWIAHTTGEMPKRLKPDTFVRFYMSGCTPHTCIACELHWDVIIAYQIVEPEEI